MHWQAKDILSILDRCAERHTFPMLDNGYVYPAATRLSLYRSPQDWACVLEVFGFSPRNGLPDTHIYTFASDVVERPTAAQYVNATAFDAYLANNPHNASRFVFPLEAGSWQDPDNEEFLAPGMPAFVLRGQTLQALQAADYQLAGGQLSDSPKVRVFEFCRALAFAERDAVLATSAERRGNIKPEMAQILQLEAWNHPNIIDPGAPPSASEAFQQLAQVLATGDTAHYQPTEQPNTHWSNWPDGGTL